MGVKGGVKCSFYNRDGFPFLSKKRGVSGLIELGLWSSDFDLEAWNLKLKTYLFQVSSSMFQVQGLNSKEKIFIDTIDEEWSSRKQGDD